MHSVVWPKTQRKQQAKQESFTAAPDYQCSKRLNWEWDVPEAFHLHQTSNIFSFKLPHGWQKPTQVASGFAFVHESAQTLRSAGEALQAQPSLVVCPWLVGPGWSKQTQLSAPCNAQANATCRRESDEGEEGRLEERRLRESSHWSTKNRRDGSVSG